MIKILLSIILVAHFAAYLVAGVSAESLLGFLATTTIIAVAGSQFLRGRQAQIQDKVVFYGIAYFIGCSLIILSGLLLYHRKIQALFGIDSTWAISALGLAALLSAAAFIAKLRAPCDTTAMRVTSLPALTLSVAIASIVTHAAFSGFSVVKFALSENQFQSLLSNIDSDSTRKYAASVYLHDPDTRLYILQESVLSGGHRKSSDFKELRNAQKEAGIIRGYGMHTDTAKHVWVSPHDLVDRMLPLEKLAHRGLQIQLLMTANALSPFITTPVLLDKVVDFMKLQAFICFLFAAYASYYLCRRAFGLSEKHSVAAPLAQLLLSPILFPFMTADWSTKAGYYKGPIQFYHNATQVFSMSFAFASVLCLYLALSNKRAFSYIPAALLLAVSYFVKPSFFMVLAPAFFVVSLLERQVFRRDKVVSYIILFMAPLYHIAYPKFFSLSNTPGQGHNLNIAFSPFELVLKKAGDTLPDVIDGHPSLQIILILLSSFAFVLPGILTRLSSMPKISPSTLFSGREPTPTELLAVLQIIALVIGVMSYSLLIEDSYRAMHGNFGWPSGAGFFLAIPLMLHLVWHAQRAWARHLGNSLLALQLANGMIYLYSIARMDRVIG